VVAQQWMQWWKENVGFINKNLQLATAEKQAYKNLQNLQNPFIFIAIVSGSWETTKCPEPPMNTTQDFAED
jgi:hypothetical protein